MPAKTRSLAAVGVLLTTFYVPARCQEPVPQTNRARLTRCTPATVTPGMWINLEGFHLDVFEPAVRLLFVQDGQSYVGSPNGGSRENSYSQDSLEGVSLTVPEGLNPGKCQIVIEKDGVPSATLAVEIAESVPQVAISNLRPHVGQPGDLIWITALGICRSDEIELIDSDGQHHFITPRQTSEGTGAAFQLPENLSGGDATFSVTGKRSGLVKNSNTLSLKVDVDTAPLVFYLPMDRMNSLAPGQWIDAGVQNTVLAERADLIEVAFAQREQLIVPVQPFKRSTNSRLHVQVPTSLEPGRVKITTRTWIKGRASSWSEPQELELLDRPTAPRFWGIYLSMTKGSAQSIDFTSRSIPAITARPGDTVELLGSFLVESASNLRLTLEASGQEIELALIETGDQARLSFAIPDNVLPGRWQMVMTNIEHAISSKVPTTLVIE